MGELAGCPDIASVWVRAVMCAGNTLLDEFTSVQSVLQDSMNSTGTDYGVTIHLRQRKF